MRALVVENHLPPRRDRGGSVRAARIAAGIAFPSREAQRRARARLLGGNERGRGRLGREPRMLNPHPEYGSGKFEARASAKGWVPDSLRVAVGSRAARVVRV